MANHRSVDKKAVVPNGICKNPNEALMGMTVPS
jgi:hypothetical protein